MSDPCMPVAAADSVGPHVDHDAVRTRCGIGNFPEFREFTELIKNGCFHSLTLRSSLSLASGIASRKECRTESIPFPRAFRILERKQNEFRSNLFQKINAKKFSSFEARHPIFSPYIFGHGFVAAKTMKSNTDLESIFAQAVELADPTRRGAFLDEVCGGDARLRNRIGRLLAANQRLATEQAESFMSEPAAILNLPDDGPQGVLSGHGIAGEQPGDLLGSDQQYRLNEIVGEGGMGSVFKAEQTKPMQRTVAVKLIKPGMDTKEVLARFDAERQSLAMMSSPHIAQVFDAGVTEQGRPFFVMEWVEGQSITDYCNERKLTTRERLELFVPVCRAIQHAHQKGVIHRDIKPSNVLVAADSSQWTDNNAQAAHVGSNTHLPKVIDFGVAKAIDPLSADNADNVTQLGELVGTPAYMSPEQASADPDIDTRSDVYSLGALLYELLVGTSPFANNERTLTREEMRHAIREETPSRPSEAFQAMILAHGKLSTGNGQLERDQEARPEQAQRDTVAKHETTVAHEVARARRSTPKELQSELRGELDWIVMRSLEKDRNRRYDTASSFADDVQRYLSNQPVVARPPTATYLLRKFISRHRVAVGAFVAIATTVLLAVCITGWALHNTKQALTRQKDESQTLQQHVAFVNNGLFAQADPLAEPNRNVTLRTILDRASQELNQQPIDRPQVEAAIRTTMGRAYFGLGEYEIAIKHLRRGTQLLGNLAEGKKIKYTNRRLIEAKCELARVLLAADRLEEAEIVLYGLMLNESRFEETDELRLSIWQLEANRLNAVGEYDQAEGYFRELLRIREQSFGDDHVQTYKAMANLAFVLHSQQRHDEALGLLEKAHGGLLQANDRWDPAALRVTANLASLHIARNELQRAKAIYQATLPKLRRVLGDTHPQTLTARHAFALIQLSEGDSQKATTELVEVLAEQTQQLGETHSSTLTTLHNLALASKSSGAVAEAKSLLERELKLRTNSLGETHVSTQQVLSSLAFLHLEQAQFAEAAKLYKRIVHSTLAGQQSNPTSSPAAISQDTNAVIAHVMLGYCLLKTGQFEAASAPLELVLSATEKWQTNDWLRYVAMSLLGEVYWKLDRRDAGEKTLLEAYIALKQRDLVLPIRWKPMGLRAATRRLAEFYESADSDELRTRAARYRQELLELRANPFDSATASSSESADSQRQTNEQRPELTDNRTPRRPEPTQQQARTLEDGKD